MSNTYLEKLAGDKLRGLVSPAWMEQSIAHKHGQKGNETLGGQYASHVGGTQRAALRSGAETVVGGATGLGVGALADKLLAKRTKGMAAPVLGIAGAVAGNIHGVYKSLKNQQGEMHAKYSGQEKKAAFDALVEQGMNYDEAVAAIEKEAGIASVVGSMARKVMASPTVGKAVNMAVKNPMRTAMGAGALATGAGALMARGSREKQACVQMLMEQGVNFEEAVEMTKQASQELYGE